MSQIQIAIRNTSGNFCLSRAGKSFTESTNTTIKLLMTEQARIIDGDSIESYRVRVRLLSEQVWETTEDRPGTIKPNQ
ncbi:MAG: hypothetical protein WA919_22150 [Coleofasciculaceae cyanobacterium]